MYKLSVTSAVSLQVLSYTHTFALSSISVFKCVREDKQLLSAVKVGSGAPRLQRGMRSDSHWLTCMQLWPVRCKQANGVEE